MESVLTAIITSVASIVLAIINYRQAVKLKALQSEHVQLSNDKNTLAQENDKLRYELKSLSLLFDVEFFQLLKEQVLAMFEETKADRFMVMFAVNGKTDFNYVSVAYEQTRTYENKGAISRYVRLNIDSHYKNLLKDVERSGSVVVSVKDMPDSLMKALYQSEKVPIKHAIFKFLTRLAIDDESDLVVFTSVATFSEKPYTTEERAVIRLLHDRIRKYASEIQISFKDYP